MPDTVLTVYLPRSRESALSWVCDFVFLHYRANIRYESHYEDTVRISDGKQNLILKSVFPNLAKDRSTWSFQTPHEPLARLSDTDLGGCAADANQQVPVLFGLPEIRYSNSRIDCSIDILGGIFFMLSRFEEIISPELDAHGRFPASASIAYRQGFLQHPLADIYRDILFSLISRLWPDWQLTKESGDIQISCDVDEPFDRCVSSLSAFIRTLGGDILKRRSASLALQRTLNYALRGIVGARFDPCFTFRWYMDLCEAHGLNATFYFISGHSAASIDGTYEIDEPRIIDLLKEIAERGHVIGMHGSYNTFNDANQLKSERSRLVAALRKAGLNQDVVENRQHYLRWDASCTPDYLHEAGIRVDSSGGFADMPGFRYGTARRFRMWSWRNMQPLDLYQKPLILMEATLLSALYLQLNESDFLKLSNQLKRRSEEGGGTFSFLWHNSELKTKREKQLFSSLLSECSNRRGHF